MTNAVIYARFSSSKQREESIEAQVRECTAFAERKNLNILRVYADHGISGTTDDRPEFLRMIQDSKKKEFSYVILYGIDRFARDRYLAAIYKHELKKNGVTLLYAKNDIPDTPEGILLESVMEGMAEYYSKNLGRNTQRGMVQNAIKGKINGGKIPLGFKSDNGYYAIDEESAELVRRMFKDFIGGKTMKELASEYQPYTSYKLLPATMRRMFENEKYIGIYSCGEEKYESIPAIIDKDIFAKAQILLGNNKHRRERRNEKPMYILSGKLFCGECGSAMNGESGTSSSGKLHSYYKCAGKKYKKTTCATPNVRQEDMENFIVNEIMTNFLTDVNIDFIARRVVKLVEKETKDLTKNMPLEKRKRELSRQASFTLDKAIEKQDDALYAKYEDLKDQLEYLESQENYETNIAPLLTVDMVAYFLSKFRDGDINSQDFRRDLIDTLVNKVIYWNNDRIDIYFNLCKNNSADLYSTSCSIKETRGHQIDFSRTLYILSQSQCLLQYRNELL